ncbi:MAG TPA: efflux RND transporter periplasmic adaptor subunit [Candidatus Eisenbergiella merdipullorum]|uniref:Efflux RND transporter periplasmic adaptor subunit n=1 Tax=Candidatus Eisenbergiella merdipullorum TaxID=2838553 RepID=A0A9D2I5G9_9FIRM|nr:efflux RND transporter periplasmic adaptor subunit [Candidatus Eisenbergiella merdipullorum]
MKKKTDAGKEEKHSVKKWPLFAAGGIFILLAGGAAGFFLVQNEEDDVAYREDVVQYGELTVGLQETGSVKVGTTEQTFELDLSAYTESGDGSFSWEQGAGSIFQGMTAGSSSASSSRSLVVEEVLITEGQEVSEGDPLYRISQDSIDEIREELTSDVADAQVTLEQTQTQLAMTQLEAQQRYETDTAYGGVLAQAEYDNTIKDLQEAVNEIEEQIAEADEELLELNEQLAEYQMDLAAEQEVLGNAEYVVETTDMVTDAYGWITAENAREDAESVIETLEEEIETAMQSIEEKTAEREDLTDSLTGAQQSLEQGLIDAQAQLSLQSLSYGSASERYDVSVGMGEFEAQVAQEDYEDAVAKLNEFDAVLGEQTVDSDHNGVVTEISLAAGDSVDTGTTLVVLSDYDEVTVTVSLAESDLENVREGDQVNVYIDAWPDAEFSGTVDEIGDAEYDSSAGTTYSDVTVKLSGDTAKLYGGMTAEITFITKETKAVTYVSNRAVYRENGKSYVHMRDEDGNVVSAEVVTGFSDGSHVEIVEGLSKGDTVLIESGVSGS